MIFDQSRVYHEIFKLRGRDGKLGKPQGFEKVHLDFMKYQHMAIENENLCVGKYVTLLLLL